MLQIIALTLIFNNLNFHRSKFINSANTVSGSFYVKKSGLTDYFNLKEVNKDLADENTRLRNLLEYKTINTLSLDSTITDSTKYKQKYTYTSGKIIKNEFDKLFNFLLINKGKNDALSKEMAVINSKGIIGIIDNVSGNYSRVQSILNKNSRINARLKNTSYFGTLKWNGNEYNIVQLEDIPRQAPVNIGDTIETDGKSAIFPEGIPIGTIFNINKKNTANNSLDIKLFNDMSNLNYVYIIKNLHKSEIIDLEKLEDE